MKEFRKLVNKVIACVLSAAMLFGSTFVMPVTSYADVSGDLATTGLEYNGYPVIRGYTSFSTTDNMESNRLMYCYSDGYFWIKV